MKGLCKGNPIPEIALLGSVPPFRYLKILGEKSFKEIFRNQIFKTGLELYNPLQKKTMVNHGVGKNKKHTKISGFSRNKHGVCFFMMDQGVPRVFHRIPSEVPCISRLGSAFSPKMWKTLFAGSSPPAEGPETQTHRSGVRGWGIFPKKKTVGGFP